MTSSTVFFKWKPPIFFLDSDSPFNCLNDSIKILLPYIRKFLRKKNNKVGKNKFPGNVYIVIETTPNSVFLLAIFKCHAIFT
jgi:hypothetical protein